MTNLSYVVRLTRQDYLEEVKLGFAKNNYIFSIKDCHHWQSFFGVCFEGQQGQQGQLFSYFRPRTRVGEYIESAVPAVPHQSLKMYIFLAYLVDIQSIRVF
jgi:hypothetical protein